MNNYFTYSLLQYKHNLTIGESINVGILFYFPTQNRFEFVKGDSYRVKAIYTDFDNSLFNAYIKTITERIKKHVDLFNFNSDKSDFSKYIHQNILAQDAAGLIFSQPVQVKNVFRDIKIAIDEYSKLLLPGIIVDKPLVRKHNEYFILKTFTGYVFDKNKSLEGKFEKNQIIKTKHFTVKFDLRWKSKSEHYIKPLSFDLIDETSIQNKAAIIFSHLTDLKEYAKAYKTSFDFLIAKPQSNIFKRDFENALDLIDSVKISKELVLDEGWKKYTQQTIDFLS